MLRQSGCVITKPEVRGAVCRIVHCRESAVFGIFGDEAGEEVFLVEVAFAALDQIHSLPDSSGTELHQWVSFRGDGNQGVVSPQAVKPRHLRILFHAIRLA